jgi:inner membrane transporter RhtA
MLSVQSGAAVSTWMFHQVGPVGAALLRLAWAAVFLLAYARPKLRGRPRGDLLVAVLLGAISAAMTMCYFNAIARIPLGVASSLEFLGPFAVAVAGLRRRADVLWPVLAAAGVLALTRPWEGQVNTVGLLFGILSGAGLGGYVIFTQKVGDRFSGVDGLALSMTVATLCTLPFGLGQAQHDLSLPVLAGSAAAALLLPVLPYALEMTVLRTLTAGALSTLMSFEPAIAALVGFVLLHQGMTWLQCAGILCVVAASIGAIRRGRRADHPPAAVPVPEA